MGFRLSLAVLLTATSAWAAWPPPQPASLELTVRENAGIARTSEVIRSGVPLPRGLNVQSATGLAVVDGLGQLVPAQFRILARWDAGLSVTTAPIQWLLVMFPSTVPANRAPRTGSSSMGRQARTRRRRRHSRSRRMEIRSP